VKDRLYAILGIKRDADEASVRSAYVQKAKQTHPDAGGDIAEFQEIAKAYAVLSDPVKRLAYDKTGQEEGAPSSEEVAISILGNLIEGVLADQRDPSSTNFVAGMRDQLTGALQNVTNQTLDVGRKMKRGQVLCARFTARGGDNLINRMIEGRIAEMERQIATLEQQAEHFRAAMKLLDSYEYRTDPRHPQSQDFWNATAAANSAYGIGGIWK
jgi:curved DNA-binding protein CbpA